MTDFIAPTADDLALFLSVDTVNDSRATLLLDLATSLARAVVSPLPAGAEAVVLSAASRAYVNPTQSSGQTAGPFNIGQPFPGLYITKNERRTLKALAGKGGAFVIDPTPIDALSHYRDPLAHPTAYEQENYELNNGWWL